MRTLLIGNPSHRRTVDFQVALAEAGLPPADVLSYAQLIEDPEAALGFDAGPTLVRQDSFGQDFEVERGLLRLGYEAAKRRGANTIDPEALARLQPERGRVLAPRQLHCGFLEVLRRIEELAAARPQWSLLQSPQGIRRLFDKAEASERWEGLGLPVAPRIEAEHWCELRGRVFVKLSCGSSASCLALFHVQGRRRLVTTTLELTPTGLYNSRRLRRYEDEASVERIWRFLRREGAHLERCRPRAKVEGVPFDLRVLAVEGRPALTVMRCAEGPMSNLHLGGVRGNWEDFASGVPAASLEAIETCCARVTEDVGCLSVGMDLLLSPDLSRVCIIEGNAFGDLLPGARHRGWGTHRWQIEAMRRRWAELR